MNKALLAVVGMAIVAGSASAQLKTYSGSGGQIPDSSSIRFEIFVPDHGAFTMDNVTINGFAHTWVGDLVVRVTHKDATGGGATSVLFDQLGVPQSTFGNSNDLNGTYVFRDGSAPMSETGAVPAGTYGPATPLSGLNGADKFGTWSLFISDNAGGDTGAITGWSIGVNNVPTPGSLALLGLGGLAAGRRRR